MKRLIAAVALASLAMPAVANDLGSFDVYEWTGAYVGAQLGYDFGGMADYRWLSLPMSAYNYSHNPNGFLGGVFLGYNYQFSNGLMLGGEADATWGNIRAAAPAPLDPDTMGATKIDWTASVRARLGYAIDRFMPYITGGAAYGRLNFAESGLLVGSGDVNLSGWTIGAGAEYAVTDNLLIRTEYRYTEFSRKSFTTTITNFDVDLNSHDIRLGISYKF